MPVRLCLGDTVTSEELTTGNAAFDFLLITLRRIYCS